MSSPNIIVGQVWVAESYLWPFSSFFAKMAPNSHLLLRLCLFMVVFCVFVFLYIVCACLFVYFMCVCLSVCVSPWESHLWPEFLLLGSAAQLSPGEREVELGGREDANRCSGEFPGKTSCLQPPNHINLTHVKSLWQERVQTHLAIS